MQGSLHRPDPFPGSPLGARGSTVGVLLSVDGQHRIDTDDGVRTPTVALSARPYFTWQVNTGIAHARADVEVRDGADRIVWADEVPAGQLGVRPRVDLGSYANYSWRVRFGDGQSWGDWYQQAFETGPLRFENWHANWLEVPPTARIRTPFSATDVRSGRLYLTGQGVLLAFLNGVRVNIDRIDPSRTDTTRALYRTYDVSTLLIDGENVLEVVAGSGEWHKTGLRPRILVQLVIRDVFGNLTFVAPDEQSEVAASDIAVDAPFYLERHSESHESDGAVDRMIRALQPTSERGEIALPPVDVTPDGSPPVRAVRSVHVVEVGRVDGMRQFDAGVNIAGRSRVVILSRLPKGTVVSVVHGEHLDARGRIDTTNLTMPFDHGRERQVVERVLSGRGDEVVEAWFAYHGFRYLEVRGLPDDAVIEVSARTVHTALPVRSMLTTDNPTINKLLTAATRTALNNVHSVPEDCPTREQAAWTGDAASANEYSFAQFDNATFVEKWLGDLETSVEPNGALPAIAPDVSADRMPADPVWGAALHRSLWSHWLNYGDASVVERYLPTVRKWAEYQLGCIGPGGLADGFPISYGQDWLALEQTPPVLIHSAAVIDTFETLAELEQVHGRPEDHALWRARAEALRTRMRALYLDPTAHSVASGSQGSFAVALEAGLVDGDDAVWVAAELARLVRERGNRVSTGFALTRTVVRALARNGYSQVIADCLAQPVEPGIGAMLATGPGTFWENWWIDPRNTGTGSLDHVGLGAPFAAWAWEHLVGIRPVFPGYAVFDVTPTLVDGVHRLDARVSTAAGEISVRYVRDDEKLDLVVQVPAGATARVTLPDAGPLSVGAGEHRFTATVTPAIERFLPPSTEHWEPPSIAPVSADAVGAVQLSELAPPRPGRGTPTITVLSDLVCMPIPHAQLGHPVYLVRATHDDSAVTVVLSPPEPIDVSGEAFLYALTDECLDSAARDAAQYLVAHFEDGTSVTGRGRVWPAGWNRVTVDLSGASSKLVAIEVGLELLDEDTGNALGVYSGNNHAGLHLGEVGLSSRMLRW